MKPETYLKLQESESVVIHAASRIFSAFVSSGQVTPENEDKMLLRAVRAAVRMARMTDRLVQSDEEAG